MTSYIFLCPILCASVCLSSGKPSEESNAVYGLPEFARDVLTKIKTATGQPVDPNRFYPIPASRGYEILEERPFAKNAKYAKAKSAGKFDGGGYRLSEGDEDFGLLKDHFSEVAESGQEEEESATRGHGDRRGQLHKYNEGRFVKTNHRKSDGGRKGSESRKGRKRGKHRVEKGFRDIYHKDEEKKSDFFWNNHREEGKWIEYGFRNQKKDKSHDDSGEGREKKSKTQELSYAKQENKCTKCKSR